MAKPKLKLLATKFAVWKTGKETPTGDLKVFALIAEENVNTVIGSREQSLPDALEKSDDWCAIKLDTVLDMSESGILNAVTAPLAAAGISILAISSFDTDYLFVGNDDIGKAIEALRAAGYELSDEGAG